MRVLITGVSGFVGRWLAGALVERGDRVAGTYVRSRPEIAGVALHEADIRDRDAVEAALEGARPDVVVHLAALSQVGPSWTRQEEYEAVNVGGTEHLLAAATDCRFVLASSAEVYGPVPEADQPITEEWPPAPLSPYARTKVAAERLALERRAVVVRSFNLVGPGQNRAFALPSFAGQLAEIGAGRREPVLEVGNLAARRDFLHVADGVMGYLAAIDRGEPGAIYNLGSGHAVSIAEALELLVEISGLAVEIRVAKERWREDDLPLLLADASRLRSLGWAPDLDLRTALEELWQTSSHPAVS